MRNYRIVENVLDNNKSEFMPEYSDPPIKNEFSLNLFDWQPLFSNYLPSYEEALEVINFDKKFHVGIKETKIHIIE